MQSVLRTDERLANIVKPTMEPFDAVSISTGDVLVVCAGFEERSVEALRAAARKGSGFKVLIVEYLPSYADNRIDELLNICHEFKLEFEHLTYDRQTPAGFGEILVQRLSGMARRLFLDISGMSRLLIVQTLVALRVLGWNWGQCFIVYSEAKIYPPTQEDVNRAIQESDRDPMFAALFLSAGVFEVTVVPELSAASLGANQSRLVSFPSFNTYQLIALRQDLQPSRYAYIHGIPPSNENKWRTESIITLNHIGKTKSEMNSVIAHSFGTSAGSPAGGSKREEHYHTSTLDYRETLECLCKIYAIHGMRDRLLISPTGSKMQVVAVGLFRAFIEDVQIVYPTPRVFTEPKNYRSEEHTSEL